MAHAIWVPHRPKTKGRPRMTRRGRTYTPADTLEHEALIRSYWDGPCYDGPVEVKVAYHPDGQSVVVRPLGETLVRPKGLRGDVDNYMKLTLDALNGTAFDDDRQVLTLAGVLDPTPGGLDGGGNV